MLRCTVHNLITDQRYAFEAVDQSAIDAKLIDKEKVYGRPAWTELIPEWWERDPGGDPQKDMLHPEQTINHPAEYTIEVADTAEADQTARGTAAWVAADAHARGGMDDNSRTSLLWLAVDPACPAWRHDRILAVQAWWSAVWTAYATVKAQIAAGMIVRYDPTVAGACPWTIWQIAGSTP